MAADLTTYDKILKEDYAPSIEKQLVTRTVMLKRMKRGGPQELEGREFVLPVEGRRTEGVGSRPGTSSSLPTAGEVGYDNAVYTPKYHWGKVAFSKVIIEHTKNNSGAFIKAADSETKSLAETMSLDINRQIWNDSTGLLSRTGTTTASTTVVLATTGGYRALGNGQIRVGMYVDILTRSNGAVIATNRKVTAVSKSGNTITIDGAAVTTGANDGVYRAGNKSGTSNYEMTGLRTVVATTGAVGGLDPSVAGQEYWAAQVIQGATPGTPEAISELRLQKLKDAVEENSNGSISLLASYYGARRAYFNLLVALKRFTKPMTLEGGFDALDFDGRPFVIDRDIESNSVYALDEDKFKLMQLTPPGWMDDEGAVLKWDQGTGYVGVYHWFVNTGTNARNCLGKLEDVTEA